MKIIVAAALAAAALALPPSAHADTYSYLFCMHKQGISFGNGLLRAGFTTRKSVITSAPTAYNQASDQDVYLLHGAVIFASHLPSSKPEGK